MTLKDIERRMHALTDETQIDARKMFGQVLEMYRDYRLDGTENSPDGDLLVFQWGIYGWGENEAFEVDLTRQTMIPRPGDEPALARLRCTLRYNPEHYDHLDEGNASCASPTLLDDFEAFVLTSPVVRAVASAEPFDIVIKLEEEEQITMA